MSYTKQIEHCMELLAVLKSSLVRYQGLSLEEYDILYGDIEEIQYSMYKTKECLEDNLSVGDSKEH